MLYLLDTCPYLRLMIFTVIYTYVCVIVVVRQNFVFVLTEVTNYLIRQTILSMIVMWHFFAFWLSNMDISSWVGILLGGLI